MKTLVALMALALGTSIGVAQPDMMVENPCDKKVPTVGSCWDCFQKLLADCDKQNPEGERRIACYTGANNYLTFCLGRTTQQQRRVGAGDSSLPNGLTFDPRNGVVYQVKTNQGFAYDTIRVYLRVMTNGEPVQFAAESFTVREGDMTTVAVLPTNLGQNRWVGVVTTFLVGNQVVSAFADSIPVLDPADLNGDGLVDSVDLMEASTRISSGTMNAAEFTSFFSNWAGRQ